MIGLSRNPWLSRRPERHHLTAARWAPVALVVVALSCAVLPTGCTPKLDVDAETAEPAAPGQATGPTPDISSAGIGEILDPAIRSLRFERAESDTTMPVVRLALDSLLLEFDILGETVRDIRYDIVHCDRDWLPSRLTVLDYIQGFAEGDIRDFAISITGTPAYTSYELMLPNQYVGWRVSGNYLLNLYDDRSGELLARLRFAVYEDLLEIEPSVQRPTNALLDRTHQEFDVLATATGANLQEPRRSMWLTVVQNGDWRYAEYNVMPRRANQTGAIWDFPGKFVFPGHREWRGLDLRTLLSSGGQVEEITRDVGGITAFLLPDQTRLRAAEEVSFDLNGGFVLADFDNRLQGRSDYATTIFSLNTDRVPEAEPVYVYGAFNHYALDEGNRGAYNTLTGAYVFRLPLRQGFYNYAYVTSAGGGLGPLWSTFEGNSFATENHYQFLVYYRPFGERYDRLIGFSDHRVDP